MPLGLVKNIVFFVPTFDLPEVKTILLLLLLLLFFAVIVNRMFTIMYLKQTMFEGIKYCSYSLVTFYGTRNMLFSVLDVLYFYISTLRSCVQCPV